MTGRPHITVCVCTFKRARMLERLLQKLSPQQTGGKFSFDIAICDNDAAGSGKAVADSLASSLTVPVRSVIQPIKNIAIARNTTLSLATGDYIAFIDDDEFPGETWLRTLLETVETTGAAGGLGPVLPHFEHTPPNWVIKGRQFERPRHATGFELNWRECRTGNVLFKRSILGGDMNIFRAEFGTGGEDQDFFRRMSENGQRFVWCDEAPVWETVPPERWDLKIMISRGLLRGKNSLRHKQGRSRQTLKSLIAAPVYSVALPFALLVGRHHAVRLLVKLADHYGRLLAYLRLNPVTERKA